MSTSSLSQHTMSSDSTTQRIRKGMRVSVTFGLALLALWSVTVSQADAQEVLERDDLAPLPLSAVPSKTFVITPTAGLHGRITPAMPQTVVLGENRSFTITPDYYYDIGDVSVDGVSQGHIYFYTFNNVTTDHIINASFVKYAVTLTLATDGNGSGTITPMVGTHQYIGGDVVTLTAVASADSIFRGWYYLKYVATANPLTFTIGVDMKIVAVFLLAQRVYLPLIFK